MIRLGNSHTVLEYRGRYKFFYKKNVPIKVAIAISIAIVFKKVNAKARAKADKQFGGAWAQGPPKLFFGLWLWLWH